MLEVPWYIKGSLDIRFAANIATQVAFTPAICCQLPRQCSQVLVTYIRLAISGSKKTLAPRDRCYYVYIVMRCAGIEQQFQGSDFHKECGGAQRGLVRSGSIAP
eukprot:scaffold193737_cov18-Prasinocladus_malaysianus.AAC.1